MRVNRSQMEAKSACFRDVKYLIGGEMSEADLVQKVAQAMWEYEFRWSNRRFDTQIDEIKEHFRGAARDVIPIIEANLLRNQCERASPSAASLSYRLRNFAMADDDTHNLCCEAAATIVHQSAEIARLKEALRETIPALDRGYEVADRESFERTCAFIDKARKIARAALALSEGK